MSGNFLPAALLLLAAGACRTVHIEEPVSISAEMRVGRPGRCWEITDDEGEPIGQLVRFDVQGSPEDSLYMVRNVWHQDLGLIDAHGRAFRYLPHHKEPAWIGCGTVLEGVGHILRRAGCALVELPFEEPARPPAPGEIVPARNPFPESGDARPASSAASDAPGSVESTPEH
jgi:hypothetical protein